MAEEKEKEKEKEKKKIVKPENKFLRVVTIAKRARQLSEGSRPLIEHPTEDVVDTALREIDAHKILVEIKKPKEFKLVEATLKMPEPAETKARVRPTKIVRPKKAKKKKK